MKTSKQLLILFAIALFSFSYTSFSQAVEHTVTLVCNTEELKTKQPYEACYFAEDPDVDPREFLITVNVGDIITWEGQSESGEDSIDIKKIKWDHGTKIFDKDFIDGIETVTGTVKHDTKNKKDFKYTIQFKVNDSGKKHKIDPKVKVNP
jgi:hypothetical protein